MPSILPPTPVETPLNVVRNREVQRIQTSKDYAGFKRIHPMSPISI